MPARVSSHRMAVPEHSAPAPLARGRALTITLLLLGLAAALYWARKQVIRSFFADAPAKIEDQSPTPVGSPALAPVRVVLLDGLGFEHARTLPALSRLCAQGQEFRVDTGFPTVSLPVQQVLWTGLTQDQSGVLYRIKPHAQAPKASLPAQLTDSVAVAESHPKIIASFGFATAFPPVQDGTDELAPSWRDKGFAREAKRAMSSNASLAFVHVLRIDEAGHASGAASPAYAAAAQAADAWLEPWVALAPQARWMILADHGHLPTGGHAGRDANIPMVRACIFGPGIAAAAPPNHASTPTVQLVDLSRELFTWSGFIPAQGSVGMPLAHAATSYEGGALLPTMPRFAWVVALLVLGIAGALTVRGAGAWPWWLALSYAGFALVYGIPSLSMPAVYPPMGLKTLGVGSLGLVALALNYWRARGPVERVVLRQVALPLACLAAAHLLAAGGFARPAAPPLALHWSAHASVLGTWCAAACLVSALFVLARLRWPATQA